MVDDLLSTHARFHKSFVARNTSVVKNVSKFNEMEEQIYRL